MKVKWSNREVREELLQYISLLNEKLSENSAWIFLMSFVQLL